MELMLNKLIKYSVIRFVPYTQREEFVNVGVVAYFPQTGEFSYRLLQARAKARVHHFFPALKENDIFSQVVALLDKELKRIQGYSVAKPLSNAFFETLIAPKDGLFQYGKVQVELVSQCTQLSAQVDRIFNELVSFEAERYKSPQHEKELTRWFRKTYLNLGSLKEQFKAESLQEKSLGVKINLPFYARNTGKSIKPLSFEGYLDPQQINHHGMSWLTNLMQASKAGVINTEKHLIVYRLPEQQTLAKAADFALDMLSSTKATLCEAREQAKIESFFHLSNKVPI
jgi:hypothetical protein